jgi:hypothetical protein
MDIKKLLWIIFGFVIVGIICVAVIALVRAQITRMNDQLPTFPNTTDVTDAGAAVQQANLSFTYQLPAA